MFKVGDRVRALGEFEGAQLLGAVGTVRLCGGGYHYDRVGVEFDVPFYNRTGGRMGHSLDGRVTMNDRKNGWNISISLLERYDGAGLTPLQQAALDYCRKESL